MLKQPGESVLRDGVAVSTNVDVSSAGHLPWNVLRLGSVLTLPESQPCALEFGIKPDEHVTYTPLG